MDREKHSMVGPYYQCSEFPKKLDDAIVEGDEWMGTPMWVPSQIEKTDCMFYKYLSWFGERQRRNVNLLLVNKYLKDTEALADTALIPSKGITFSFLEDTTTTTLQEVFNLLHSFDYNTQVAKRVSLFNPL
jgi:hypothetical protein